LLVATLYIQPYNNSNNSAYMYTVSRENAFLCEKVNVYIGNFGGNNVKGE